MSMPASGRTPCPLAGITISAAGRTVIGVDDAQSPVMIVQVGSQSSVAGSFHPPPGRQKRMVDHPLSRSQKESWCRQLCAIHKSHQPE
jgi:hypothetical protein